MRGQQQPAGIGLGGGELGVGQLAPERVGDHGIVEPRLDGDGPGRGEGVGVAIAEEPAKQG